MNNKKKSFKIYKVIIYSFSIFLFILFAYFVSLAFTNNSYLQNKINSSYFQKEEELKKEYYSDNYFLEELENIEKEIAKNKAKEIEEEKKEEEIKNSLTNNQLSPSDYILKEGKYVEVVESCDPYFGGECVRARACPSTSCPVVTSLRNGMVLKATGETIESEGITWHHIVFDEWVRYSDRLASEWYVSSDYLKEIDSYRIRYTEEAKVENLTDKKIVISRNEQKLYAYNGEELFMEILISTGLDDLPTPRGTFNIFEKTPSRYMQGPLPGISGQYYDLPGVSWVMYFTYQGGAIHGAYWHDNFGHQWSHGCVNLTPEDAEKLYNWADLGTTVIVRD